MGPKPPRDPPEPPPERAEFEFRLGRLLITPGALAALTRSLGVRGVVVKERTLYLWRHTRIHFDEVEGLGSFLELETVARDIDLEAAEAEAREAIAALALDRSLFLDRPYLELLESMADQTGPGRSRPAAVG